MIENKLTTNAQEGDLVHCNNCEKDMLVDIGTDTCPCCKKAGTLSWKCEPREYSLEEVDTLNKPLVEEKRKEEVSKTMKSLLLNRFSSLESLKQTIFEKTGLTVSLSYAQHTEEEYKDTGADYQIDGTFGENQLGMAYADFTLFYLQDNATNICLTEFCWEGGNES